MPISGALPEIIPVFPLEGALLLPAGRLPLRIFEPRYLEMIDDALGTSRLVGMIQPLGSQGAQTRLYSVGCVGKLTSWSETSEGRYAIVLSGLCRFKVLEEVDAPRLYRMVKADYAPYASDLEEQDDEQAFDRRRLEDGLKRFLGKHQLESLWPTIEELPGTLLVNSLSMVCPFAPAEKQALLESPTTAERARLLMTLVEMNAAGAADPEGTLQ
jgi:Lon protease-like protein